MGTPRTHAKRAFLTGRPRVQTQWVWGPFERRRWAIFGAKLGIFLALPWIQVGGAPALLFDIPARRYHVFGQVFWPQDFYMLGLVLAVAAVLLFATSALVGRVFCGHACPQTLLTSLFMAVDHLIEGDRPARLALDAGGGSWRQKARRVLKHAVWLAIAGWLGFTFASYFAGRPPAIWLAVTVATYLFAGHLRDFVCTTVCPYGRFQGAMQDPRSLVVAYDAVRGEPRGKGREQVARGGCVDCGACVTACPMGIDVRNGLQYECITCMRCIDACNHTMAKIGAAPDLIRLAETRSAGSVVNPDAAQAAPRDTGFRRPRPRLAWYGFVLATLAGLLAWLVLTRPMLQLEVARDRRTAFTLADARSSNLYALKLLNKDTVPHRMAVELAGLDGELVLGEPAFTLAPGEIRELRASVLTKAATPGQPRPFRFRLVDAEGRTVRDEVEATFLAP